MATATITLGLNSSPLVQGLAAANNRIRQFGAASTAAFRGFGGGVLAGGVGAITTALSGRAFVSGIGNAINMGSQLRNLSHSTGIAVGELYELQGVFAENDKGSEEMGASLARMQRAIGDSSKKIEELGLSNADLARQRPSEQFQSIARAILDIPSPAGRAAAAMGVFGKSGATLLPVLEDVLKLDFSKLSHVAQVMQKNAEAFDETGDAMTRLKRKLDGFYVGAASKLLESIGGAAGAGEKEDFVSLGEKFGAWLSEGINRGIDMAKQDIADVKKIFGITTPEAPTAKPDEMPKSVQVDSGSGWGRLEGFKSFVDPTFNDKNRPSLAETGVDAFYGFFGSGGNKGKPGEMGHAMDPRGGGVTGMNAAYGRRYTTAAAEAAAAEKEKKNASQENKAITKPDMEQVMDKYWGGSAD